MCNDENHGANLTPNPATDTPNYLYNKPRLAGYCIYGDRYFASTGNLYLTVLGLGHE